MTAGSDDAEARRVAEAMWRALTPAQRKALLVACKEHFTSASQAYPPIHKLTALGLVEGKAQRFGGWSVKATDLGLRVRAAGLAAQDPAPVTAPMIECPKCHGVGGQWWDEDGEWRDCTTCDGADAIPAPQTLDDHLAARLPCSPAAWGTAGTPSAQCTRCWSVLGALEPVRGCGAQDGARTGQGAAYGPRGSVALVVRGNG